MDDDKKILTSPNINNDIPALPEPSYFGDDRGFFEKGIANFKRKIFGPRPSVNARKPVKNSEITYSPYISICRLVITYDTGKEHRATGFLLDGGMVATSAHVIHFPDSNIGKAASIHIEPGFQQPAGNVVSQISTIFRTNEAWGTSPQSFRAKNDYGVIMLRNPTVFHGYGFMNFRAYDNEGLNRLIAENGNQFIMSGYPGEKNGQWYQIDAIGDERFRGRLSFVHHIHATKGQSGSPFFLMDNSPGGAAPLALGIHSKASSDYPGAFVACRVTDKMIADYQLWADTLGTTGNAPIS